MANCLVVNLLKYGMSHCDNRDADTSMQYSFYHEFLILLNLLLRKKKLTTFPQHFTRFSLQVATKLIAVSEVRIKTIITRGPVRTNFRFG